MNIIDKIGRTLGFSDEYDEKIIEKTEPEIKETAQPEKNETTEKATTPKNVFDFNSATALSKENSLARQSKYQKAEIKTIKPKNFSDSQSISKLLRNNITVIVNLEETDPAEAQRIVDYVSGTTYAIGGKTKPISPKVFIFAPDVVTVESYEDEKRSKGNFLD